MGLGWPVRWAGCHAMALELFSLGGGGDGGSLKGSGRKWGHRLLAGPLWWWHEETCRDPTLVVTQNAIAITQWEAGRFYTGPGVAEKGRETGSKSTWSEIQSSDLAKCSMGVKTGRCGGTAPRFHLRAWTTVVSLTWCRVQEAGLLMATEISRLLCTLRLHAQVMILYKDEDHRQLLGGRSF